MLFFFTDFQFFTLSGALFLSGFNDWLTYCSLFNLFSCRHNILKLAHPVQSIFVLHWQNVLSEEILCCFLLATTFIVLLSFTRWHWLYSLPVWKWTKGIMDHESKTKYNFLFLDDRILEIPVYLTGCIFVFHRRMVTLLLSTPNQFRASSARHLPRW